MKIQEFIRVFEEDVLMVEPGTVELNTELSELEDWDSLAMISLSAAIDTHFGITVPGETIKKIRKLSDVVAILRGHLED